MDDEFGEVARGGDAMEHAEFEPARFRSELGLPDAGEQALKDAAAAVHQEYCDGSQWKRLICDRVSIFAERDRGTVYVVHVNASVDFDWTWEGAKAFRPNSGDADEKFADPFYDKSSFGKSRFGQSQPVESSLSEADYKTEVVWSGEIVEVDEREGCLFISLDNPELPPTVGAFFVRPYEFLSVLDDIFNGDEFSEIRTRMLARLNAAEGNVHPSVSKLTRVGMPELRSWWQHSWCVLWGPPGTGKTWTTGQQIASIMEDEDERVLVVSTTNRATDAVALSIGEAAKDKVVDGRVSDAFLRIGKGAAYQAFVAKGLDSMLRGTESEILSKIDALTQQLQLFESSDDKALTRTQIGELRASVRDQSRRIFVDSSNRVVVATAFKAISFLKDDMIRKMIEDGDAPFTTIFIDEAGLISRAVVAALSLLAAKRIVLVGDSKQLAPISRISRILPTRQQNWLASSGLSHLDDTDLIPNAVHLLSEQRRMHPDVCKVVSHFQYDGILTTAVDRVAMESHLAPFIADVSRAIWYVLDEEDAELVSIRAGRGPGNKSWIRDVTPNVLQKLFSDPRVREANGLFISPFKAQAQSIAKLLANWEMKNWEASTVHSQQGSEADIVVFDTVNAGSGTWQIPEWKRLVNVALSRAREAVIVLASRSEMDEPYLRPLKHHLKAAFLEPLGKAASIAPSAEEMAEGERRFGWKIVERRDSINDESKQHSLVQHSSINYSPPHYSPPHDGAAESRADYKTKRTVDGLSKSSRLGEQFANRRGMKPVLSQEQQRLTNLDLDGRPRLVRGVAGSGKSVVLCNWLAKTAMRFRGQKDARIWAVYANRSLHKLLQESIESAWGNLSGGDLFERSDFPWEMVSLLHVKDVLAGMLPIVQMSIESVGFDYDQAAEEFLNRQDAAELLPRCSALFIDEAQDMGPSTLRLLLSIVEQSDQNDTNSRPAHVFYDNAQNVYDMKIPKWSEFGLDMRGRSTIMRESFRSTAPITELAVNVLERLSTNSPRRDQQELLSLGLLEKTKRGGEDWLRVQFNQIDGPKPIYRSYANLNQEINAIAAHLKHLIENDGISPTDICMIYNGQAKQILETQLAPKLNAIGVELSFQTNRSFERQANTLLATTAQSYKGYESEVVIIPCLDHYVAKAGKILDSSLYVAMTRARSLLAIYGLTGGSEASRRIGETLAACVRIQNSQPLVE